MFKLAFNRPRTFPEPYHLIFIIKQEAAGRPLPILNRLIHKDI